MRVKPLEKLYTVNDIAQMTQLSTRTIRRYLQSGELQGKKVGHQWRFTEKDLARFMDNSTIITALDEADELVFEDFRQGNILIEPNLPKAYATVIYSFHNDDELKKFKDELLSLYNEKYANQHHSLKIRVLTKNQLRLTLFGPLIFLTNYLAEINQKEGQ